MATKESEMGNTANGTMRRFLNEWQFSTGRTTFIGNLLDPSPFTANTIVIPRETLVKFRNDYLLLMKFAALFCGRSVEDLCPLDLLAPFLKQATDANNLLDEWLSAGTEE